MDPNRKLIDACANTIDDCKTAYNDYHRFISKNFGQNFMIKSKYVQGMILKVKT